jgi:kynureninase
LQSSQLGSELSLDEILKMQREALEALDRIDPLAPLRDKFLLPPGVIYLDGNSLGALPRSTAARVSRVIEKEWGEDLITSWNRHDWMAMPQRVGDKIARLIGADAGEVVVAESTSINLYKVLRSNCVVARWRDVYPSVLDRSTRGEQARSACALS